MKIYYTIVLSSNNPCCKLIELKINMEKFKLAKNMEDLNLFLMIV